MLAQNFKTAQELDITEEEHSALIAVLGMLERNELPHVNVEGLSPSLLFSLPSPAIVGFNMRHWHAEASCGTVCCIRGAAEVLMGKLWKTRSMALCELFLPGGVRTTAEELLSITPEQAARALRAYLNTGTPDWGN